MTNLRATTADPVARRSDIRAGGSERKPFLPTAWIIYAVIVGSAVIVPITVYFSRAFEPGAFSRFIGTAAIGETIITTILLAAGSTVVGAVAALALASLVMKVPARWRGFSLVVPQLPLVIPPVAMIYGWIFIFSPEIGYGNSLLRQLPFLNELESGPLDVYSIPGIILLTAVDLTGFIYAFVSARLLEINGSLGAAARITGASGFRAFMTVTLPLLRPALVAGIVVAFLIGLGQFTAPLLLGARDNVAVVTTEIFRVREQYPIDYALTAALGLPLLIIGVLSIMIQRRVIGDQRRYSTQGSGRGVEVRESRWALVGVFAYGAVTIIIPLAGNLIVAMSKFWNGNIAGLTLTFDNFKAAFENSEISSAIVNTISVSVVATVIALPLGLLAALAMSGIVPAPQSVRIVLDYIFLAPMVVPRALLGLVVLYVFIRPPFSLYGSIGLFIIGFVFIVLPYSLRSQYSSLIGVHSSLFEAARICGASQFRTVIGIAVPLARRGIAAAMTMSFIMLSNDFAVAIMLRTPENQVMGTLLYEFGNLGQFPDVAVLALIMTVITAVILGITIRLGGRGVLQSA